MAEPKSCELCGVHYPGYQTAGDEVVDLCACCYGEPYDPAECSGQPAKHPPDLRW